MGIKLLKQERKITGRHIRGESYKGGSLKNEVKYRDY